MNRHGKTLESILLAHADANIAFRDLRQLLLALGFTERVRGSHHIFTRQGIAEIVNLQPLGATAKPYQVRQIRGIILRYRLRIDDEHAL